jgi:hypothetical protein
MPGTFTNFCCRSGGSNLNAGTRTGDTTEPGTGPFKSYVSGTWVQATRTFTPAGGANPVTDGIAVGDFVSIFPDAATVSPYVARITTVTATTFITSNTAKSGTAPVDGATNTTANIGGAWKGPNAAEAFPIGFVASAMTNVAGNIPRINFKNTASYSITAAMTQAVNGPLVWQGYNSSYGDGGLAIIDGGSSGASYILLTLSGSANQLQELIFQNNGATGSATGVLISGARNNVVGCVVNNVVGHGIQCTQTSIGLIECEAYSCNTSNTSALGGFASNNDQKLIRCISHDNSAGANAHGLVVTATGVVCIDCIFDTNSGNGILVNAQGQATIENCDFYNNSVNGILIANASIPFIIESCNFLKNTTAGINIANALGTCVGNIRNCGFGTGTMANGTDIINDTNILESGNISYASGVTPWAAPDTGNFKITLAAAINAGRGTFTETQASYTGTVGFPVIGAAQAVVSALLSAGLAALRLIGVGRW